MVDSGFCRLGYPFLNYQILYFTYASLSFTEKSICVAFSDVFKLCEAEKINFVEYFVIDKHFFEQICQKFSLKVSYMSFLIAGIRCIICVILNL